MASHSKPRDDERLYFTSKNPHFFKFLLIDAIQHGKLKIPTQFVRKYGGGISSPVFLKVPSGEIWQVELTKSNGEIWLQSGWREFVEHHSLELQDFIIFRYEGNCLFHVVIFDKSSSEIEYPIISNQNGNLSFNGDSQGPKIKLEEDDISIGILDEMPPGKKRREKSPPKSSRPSKKKRCHSNANGPEINVNLHTSVSEFVSNGINISNNRFQIARSNRDLHRDIQGFNARESNDARKSYRGINDSQKHRHQRRNERILGKEKAKALQIASSFKSLYPFFTTVMQPSFISNRYRMGIPKTFARQYLMQNRAKVLCVIHGKTWSMDYNNQSKQSWPKLCNGWKQFAHDNKMEVGDVCVFELVKSTEIRFNVVIFRSDNSCQSLADENGTNGVKEEKSLEINQASKSIGAISSLDRLANEKHQTPQGNFHQVRQKKTAEAQDTQEAFPPRTFPALEASSNFTSEYPNCKVLLRPCYMIHGGLSLPVAFTRRYILAEKGSRMVTLQIAEKSWPAKLTCYGSRYCITGGWVPFARENSLKANDLCVFELINSGDAVLRVSIFKHAG